MFVETNSLISRPTVNMNHKFYVPSKIISHNANQQNLKKYFDSFLNQDMINPANLPFEIKTSTALSPMDVMASDQYCKSKMYGFLDSIGICDYIDMFLVSGDLRIGMICMYRTESSGRFSEYEKLTAKKVCTHLASNYKMTLDYERQQKDLDLFRKTCNHDPVAKLILDNQQQMIYRNDLASDYCDDIAEAQSINTSENRVLAITAVQNAIRRNLSEIELRGKRHLYHFTIVPLRENPDYEDQLYSVYINFSDAKSIDLATCRTYNLTEREVEISALVMQGLTNIEISETLYISFHTVKTHMTNIFKKTKSTNRTEMVSYLTNM
jgi:DNA-binding CsgD family transcriptional regulator